MSKWAFMFVLMGVSIISAILGIEIGKTIKEPLKLAYVSPEPAQIESTPEQRLANYFRENGSPIPEELARVVLSSRYPIVKAAQAVVESNGRPNAIGAGGEIGIWQISDYWGDGPWDLEEQSVINTMILEDRLTKYKGNMVLAICRYNGSGYASYTYYRKVQREMDIISKLL